MANDVAGRVWILDTAGIITKSPVKINGGTLVPNAAADAATLKYFWAGSPNDRKSSAVAATATVATNQLTSAGNFTAAKVAVGDGLVIEWTNTGNNTGTFFVVSRDSDNAVTLASVGAVALTNEATKLYTWSVYTSRTAAQITSAGTEKCNESLDELPVLPNLVLSAISGSAKLYLNID
jgi:hypothetical protein